MLEHGGRLQQAVLDYGIPLADWLDLSAAINPAPWPAPPLPDSIWQRLPDNDAAVNIAAANYYGSEHLLAIAGSQSAIGWLPQLRPPGCVLVFEPGYAEHAVNWQAAGHEVRSCPISQRDVVLQQLAAGDLPTPDVVIVINPHNPTGDVVKRELLLRVHARLAVTNGWLLIDEAFADGGAAASCIHSEMPEGLIVLRSLGKFFGLPGLRSGFAFAAPALLAELRERTGPWPLTTAAQYLLPLAFGDLQWQAAAATILRTASSRLRQQLSALGRPLHTGTSLFQSVQFDSPDEAAALQRQLAQQGILVRHYRGSSLLRLGLPARPEHWQRLATAIANIPGGR